MSKVDRSCRNCSIVNFTSISSTIRATSAAFTFVEATGAGFAVLAFVTLRSCMAFPRASADSLLTAASSLVLSMDSIALKRAASSALEGTTRSSGSVIAQSFCGGFAMSCIVYGMNFRYSCSQL